MSDLFMYELEDNVWDEFGESDDHIVPRPGDEDWDKCAVQGDSREKARHGVIDMTDNNATKYVIHGKEGRVNKKDRTINDSRMAGHCHKGDNIVLVGGEFCGNDPILVESNNNSYDYPLSHISQTDNELSFYDNDVEDKDSSHLLYDGWPDIGNFEDVDRMLRSCDSTFGLGSLSNDDELCWFPHSHAAEGPEKAGESGFKFSCPGSTQSSVLKNVSDQNAPSVQNDTGPSIDDSDRKSLSLSDNVGSQATVADALAASGCIQFVNELDAKSENSSQSVHKGQIGLQRNQSKHHGRRDGERKDCYSTNVGSFHHSSNLKQFDDVKQPFGDSSKSNQVFSPTDIPAPLTYMQTHAPYMHLDFSNPSDQMTVPSLSGTKSESNSYPSPSLKESSHALNLVQSMESSHGPLFKPAAITNEMKKNIHGWHDVQAPFSGNFKHADIASPDVVCNRVSGQKQMHQSENEIDGHSEFEGAGIAAELDSSNVQESTCMSSAWDEVSPQATSFRQLQQVMEQLDIRTKLCIRDSLYRLARSAEQRHNCLNPSAGLSNDRDVNGALVADETNKCTGFMDIETDTNPIDRSIAHLLFHRPQDPSVMPPNDPPSLKSHAMVHESPLNPPMSEKQILQEIAAGTDNKSVRDGEE